MIRHRTLQTRRLPYLRDEHNRIFPVNGYGDSAEINLSQSGTLFPDVPGFVIYLERSSNIATYIDRDGIVAFASRDTPRFTHDPVTRSPLGLLVEGASTNVLLHSETFNAAAWTDTNITRVSTNNNSPANTSTALRVSVAPAATGFTQHSLVTSATRVMSVWLRRVGAGTGTARISLTGATGGVVVSSIPTTWTRYSSAAAAGTTPRISITNTGISNLEVEIWGAQAETVSTGSRSGPTSYIPTTASTASRTGDFFYIGIDPNVLPKFYGMYMSGTNICLGSGATTGLITVEDINSESQIYVDSNINTLSTRFYQNYTGSIATLSTSSFTPSSPYSFYFGLNPNYFQFQNTLMEGEVQLAPVDLPSIVQIAGGIASNSTQNWARTVRDIKFFPRPLNYNETERLLLVSP